MDLKVKRFEFGKDENEWNSFLEKAKNTTFLFNRSFMDYHKDRFVDHSVMVYDKKNNLVACFPAHEHTSRLISSHSGLTYGAFIIEKKLKMPVILNVYYAILRYYERNGFNELNYKAFPRIYNTLPSDEIDYCLFITEAKLYRRDAAIVVNQNNRIKYSGNIRREAKKAERDNIIIQKSKDFVSFWKHLLEPNLNERFGVSPVHSHNEIELLKNRFPENIKLYIAKSKSGTILAGTVFFITENVAHCQYIATSNEGRNSGALNLLFIILMDEELAHKQYFDFGIVNEDEGKKLNAGMLGWKERMGGRAISHDFYTISTSNYTKIEFLLNE